jgi:hypothetical protein
MQHILTHFPLMPSTFLHLHQMNMAWFMVVGESLPWNALEVMKVDHKSYCNQKKGV